MTKKYTLTTSEETVTENPEDIIRLMKLAGLTNAQPVAEEEVTEEVRDFANTPGGTDEEQLQLDPTDFEKKTGDGITKQKKSIQPSHGDNPLEYSLDENEIEESLLKEFDKEETEELEEAQSPAQKAAFAKMLAAKDGKKDEAVEEKEETTEEKVEETTVEENLEKAQEEIDELKEETISEDCGCGHGSDCDCGPECDCGCNAVTEAVEEVTDGTREELTRLIQTNDSYLNFPSNPSAADFLGDMKIILKQVFSSQGTKVPEEIADLYNKLLAYHKDKELQAKNRKIPSDNSNHAPYYPENMDEEYVASFADPFYDAFQATADALGIDDLDADQSRLKDLINYKP